MDTRIAGRRHSVIGVLVQPFEYDLAVDPIKHFAVVAFLRPDKTQFKIIRLQEIVLLDDQICSTSNLNGSHCLTYIEKVYNIHQDVHHKGL